MIEFLNSVDQVSAGFGAFSCLALLFLLCLTQFVDAGSRYIFERALELRRKRIALQKENKHGSD